MLCIVSLLVARRNAFAIRMSKYSESDRKVITSLLRESELPRDALPYTAEFDRLKAAYEKTQSTSLSDHDFWQLLCRIGKYGGTRGSKRKTAPKAPTLSHEEQLELLRLFPDGIGKRDDLPYTFRFNDLYKQYSKLIRRNLSKRDFWRVVSRVGKLSRKPKAVFDGEVPVGNLPRELVQFLERTNPWWFGHPFPVEGYRRAAFHTVLKRLKTEVAPAVIMRGSRQVGKTTIQMQVIEHLLLIKHVQPKQIMRVQFDDVPGLGQIANPVEAIVRWFEQNVLKGKINESYLRGEPIYLFLDELQNLPKWADQLKALLDTTKVRVFMTGSSALRIAGDGDSLAGRRSSVELSPLRLSEIVGIRRLPGALIPYATSKILEEWKRRRFWEDLIKYGRRHRVLRKQAFELYSDYGGYPRAHVAKLADIGELRQQIVDDVVMRTISHDARSSAYPSLDERLIREVFQQICKHAGEIIRPDHLAQQLEKRLPSVPSKKSIFQAIDVLVDCLLVRRINALDLLGNRQDSPPKLCVCDPFVRSGVLQETIPIAPSRLTKMNQAVCATAGHLIESVIGTFLCSIPGLDVACLPKRNDDPEIDFVLNIGEQRIPIEVKYQRKKPTPKDYAGIDWFCSKTHFNAPFGLLITQETARPIGKYVIAIPASTFLLLR